MSARLALGIITGLLAIILFPLPAGNDFYVAESFWTRALTTALSWMSLFAILLFLGYLTKSSATYSRRVLLTWFVITPFDFFFLIITDSEH